MSIFENQFGFKMGRLATEEKKLAYGVHQPRKYVQHSIGTSFMEMLGV